MGEVVLRGEGEGECWFCEAITFFGFDVCNNCARTLFDKD